MKQAEFDKFAEEYRSMHAANIRLSGESPDFFAEYKIRDTATWCRRSDRPVNAIVDFGCGTGNSVPHFRRHFPQASLTGADPSAKSLEIADARFPGQAKYVPFDGDQLPFPDNSFDMAFSACVFHHIPHGEHVGWLTELRRVVRPGGVLAIFEHNPFNPLTVRAVNDCPFDENAHLIKAAHLQASIVQAGWERTEIAYKVFFPGPLARLRAIEPYLEWLPLGAQYAAFAHR